MVHKSSKIHFLTAYIEYLFDTGVRSEEYYVGDASRFMRYLLANITEQDVLNYINDSARSKSYKNRLKKTLKKFFRFGTDVLDLDNLSAILKKPDDNSSSG